MKKLTLREDIFTGEEPGKEEPIVDDRLSLSNMISAMIKGEWDAIDLYNSMVLTIDSMGGHPEAIETIKDIVKEEYIHVGQLEKLLQVNNNEAEKIEDGQKEFEDEAGIEEPVEDKEIPEEPESEDI